MKTQQSRTGGEHGFCRSYLKVIMEEVRTKTTVEQRKAACAGKLAWGGQGEFYGPDRFYWSGQAHCTLHARAQGWAAWLRSQETS